MPSKMQHPKMKYNACQIKSNPCQVKRNLCQVKRHQILAHVHEQRVIDITWPTRAPQKRPQGAHLQARLDPLLDLHMVTGAAVLSQALRCCIGREFRSSLVVEVMHLRAWRGRSQAPPQASFKADFSHLAMNIFPGHRDSGNVHPVQKKRLSHARPRRAQH